MSHYLQNVTQDVYFRAGETKKDPLCLLSPVVPFNVWNTIDQGMHPAPALLSGPGVEHKHGGAYPLLLLGQCRQDGDDCYRPQGQSVHRESGIKH